MSMEILDVVSEETEATKIAQRKRQVGNLTEDNEPTTRDLIRGALGE